MLTRPPRWFTVVAVLLLLWGIAGCVAFYSQARFGAQAMAGATEYDRRLFASLPGWFFIVYGVAVAGGLLGAAALLSRSRRAVPLFALSLIAVAIQFGWTFLATDLLAAKGAAETVPFPIFIAAMAAFQLWLARRAQRRGWIG